MFETNDIEIKKAAKTELMCIASILMPQGKPNILSIIKYPMIKKLISEYGEAKMCKAVFLLIKDFCNSMNVVRNMNEDQMLECSKMLIDECDNFRLEDYVIMFQMAKRGTLVDIHDRIDMQVITKILDSYWLKRHKMGEKMQEEEEINPHDHLTDKMKYLDFKHPQDSNLDKKMLKLEGRLQETIIELKEKLK